MADNVIQGRKGKLEVGETPTLVGAVTEISIEETADEIETTAMGESEKSFQGGLRDGSMSIDAYFVEADAGRAAIEAAFLAGTTIPMIYTPDKDSGTKKFSGNVMIKTRTIAASKDDLVKVSFSGRGVMTEGAVS